MDIKEEIKNSIRLSEVIGKNISLKRRDKSNYIALCPFHKEKTPSFNVSDDKGFFHCFGCGKNGDIFTYVMEMENVTFVDALKKLADQAGINYNYGTFSENLKLKNPDSLLFLLGPSPGEGSIKSIIFLKKLPGLAIAKISKGNEIK